MTLDLLSAFFIGLLGAGHCIVMCGGITSMLTSALPQNQATQVIDVLSHKPELTASRQPPLWQSKTFLVFFYNFGRIMSYSLIGAIIGYTGSLAARNAGMPLAGLRLVAGVFLILLGLYMGQWLMWLNRIEALGKGLWQYISPLSKKVIPVDTPIKALGLGAIWGWLPCGLVYSTLTWSLASGSAFSGAATMFFFGLGTLPALLTMSLGIIKIKVLLTHRIFRKSMAILIIVYGFYSVFVASRVVF